MASWQDQHLRECSKGEFVHNLSRITRGLTFSPMTYTFTVTDAADESVRIEILQPLRRYNESQAGPSHHRALAVVLKDHENLVVGGLWGATSYGWLFIQLLVVPEIARGAGVGKQLMSLAESEAIARGCHSAWLDTFEFQARGFYEDLGYSCFGELPNYPHGFVRHFMQKSLGPSQTKELAGPAAISTP